MKIRFSSLGLQFDELPMKLWGDLDRTWDLLPIGKCGRELVTTMALLYRVTL